MRRPDLRNVAAIVTLIAAPYNLCNAVATYTGYALPFGRIATLGTSQRVAAALLSTTLLLALLLVGLATALPRLNALCSGASEFAWSALVVFFGAVVLAALLLMLLDPVLDVPGLRPWSLPIIVAAEGVWFLAGLLFYMGVGETD
jgi:hypothetical protein